MSIINKKPYIKTILEELNEDNLKTLNILIDGGSGTAIFRSFINPGYFITDRDRGVSRCKLETKEKLYTGYLVYGINYCTLIFYGDNQSLGMLKIDVDNISYAKIDEYLDINELRSELDDTFVAKTSEIIDAVKNAIEGGELVVGGNLFAIDNVDLTSGSASKVLSPANWLLASDKTRDCSIVIYVTAGTQNVYPVGEFIELKRVTVSDTQVIFGGSFEANNDDGFIVYDVSATFTENAGTITIHETEINKALNGSEYPDLHNITFGGETYVVPENIEVQANPILAGTEAELLGLQVGSTKYQMPALTKTDDITFNFADNADYSLSITSNYASYCRIVGSMMVFVCSFNITKNNTASTPITIGTFSNIPNELFEKLVGGVYLDESNTRAFVDGTFTSVVASTALVKGSNNDVSIMLQTSNLVVGTTYHIRHMSVFLLTDNLAGIDSTLSNNSWSTIKAVCEQGVASNYWAVGDTKTDAGTDGNTRTFRIADMTGMYGKHVVFEQVELEPLAYQWNSSSNVDSDNCSNNYNISNMRNTHLPAIMTKYSSSLQNSLTNTTYKVATNGNNGTILNLTNKLFLPAEKEIWATRYYSRTEEFDVLTTFSYYMTHTAASDRIKYRSLYANNWWLRSPNSGDPDFVCRVGIYGGNDYYRASASNGVATCFSL